MNDNTKSYEKLDQFWKREQIRRYIISQIQDSTMKIQRITNHYVYLYYQVSTNHQNLEKNARFFITLGKGFPASPPQVHTANNFMTPALNDYRDLLEQIIKRKWTIHDQLKIIHENIPKFIESLILLKNNYFKMQKIGIYHRERIYQYVFLKGLLQHDPFITFEVSEQTVSFYIIAVTSTHFIVFKPKKQPYFHNSKLIVPKEAEISQMKIDFVAEIQSFGEIDHNRDEKNEYNIQLCGHQVHKDVKLSIWRKKVKISKSTDLISLVIKTIKHFNVSIEFQPGCCSQTSNQFQLLEKVNFLQKNISKKTNQKMIFQLNSCYQKLVQHYSSLNLPYDEVYLSKIAGLYNRADINHLMFDKDSPQKQK